MPFKLDVVYLLILVAVSLLFIFVLRALQRSALNELSRTLHVDNDPDRYQNMLQSKRLSFVLRRSTVALLQLDGYLYADDAKGVWAACEELEQMRLRQVEKLNWYQKALSYAVTGGDKKRAKDYLGRMQQLLEQEKDSELQAVLKDAELLVGVYIDKNTRLIPKLEKLAQKQEGNQLGLTQYRLAKLHHFDKNDEKAVQYLQKAQQNLEGTVWSQVVRDALEDTTVLEAK